MPIDVQGMSVSFAARTYTSTMCVIVILLCLCVVARLDAPDGLGT